MKPGITKIEIVRNGNKYEVVIELYAKVEPGPKIHSTGTKPVFMRYIALKGLSRIGLFEDTDETSLYSVLKTIGDKADILEDFSDS